ncbi:MAG: Unknown protein [uncultured Sulfurovum sp.]|uniref:Type II toxin-antitoxin system PemK/MazF family toxin n=1 Tax=uncultured Sulfurovum sp. TaxID=269237 RepID=A0A6S6SW85_9BACT|nr:MAG: Unknown protein [uncultured Sulfurovum sp.]
MDLTVGDIVLCEFYFSDLKRSKKRPVLVFKDNLPHNDFIAIPISSQISKMHNDELLLSFKSFQTGSIPKDSKLMLRKTFVVSKNAIAKKYGTLSPKAYTLVHHTFCQYFKCIANI